MAQPAQKAKGPSFPALAVASLAAFAAGLANPHVAASVPAREASAPHAAKTSARAFSETGSAGNEWVGLTQASAQKGGLFRAAPAPAFAKPSIAIVIDDLGASRDVSARAAALPASVTLAFLPLGPGSSAQAASAEARGHEVILHLPLEPEGRDNPGAGAIFDTDSGSVVAAKLARDLALVPGAAGVNNHMGSRFTADPAALRRLFAAMRGRGLFFVDSRTGPNSQAARIAEDFGISSAERQLFLDADARSQGDVLAALREAEAIARTKGAVLVIGHPRPETLSAIEGWAAQAAADGIELVSAGEHVRRVHASPAISERVAASAY